VKGATALNERQADMTGRVLGDVAELAGNHDADARETFLKKGTESWSEGARGFGGLRRDNPVIDPRPIMDNVSHPDIQAALHHARLAGDLLADGGNVIDDMVTRLAKMPEGPRGSAEEAARVKLRDAVMSGLTTDPEGRPLSFQDVQSLKWLLDAKVNAAWDKKNAPLARAYEKIRDGVVNGLEQSSQGFKRANEVYSLRSRLVEMLKEGSDALHTKESVDVIKRGWAGMSKLEQKEWRTGIASKLVTDLQNAETNQNVARRLALPSQAMREKLKIIFGDDKTFAKFLSRAEWEQTMAHTKNAVGGSQTHLLGADAMFNPISVMPSRMSDISPTHIVDKFVNKVVGKYDRNATQNIAGNVADQVLTQGADKIEALFGQMNNLAPLLSRRVLGGIGAANGAFANHLF
jgi:hypothetical protein